MPNTLSSDPTSFANAFRTSAFVGLQVMNLLYGATLVFYLKIMAILLTNKGLRKRSNLFYALFSTILVVCGAIWVICEMVVQAGAWFSSPYRPDYWEMTPALWYVRIMSVAALVLELLVAALMIHRCRIVWASYRIIIFPLILWVTILALGIVLLYIADSPGGNMFAGTEAAIALSYYAISVGLSTVTTCLICYRVLRHGQKIKAGLGDTHASLYFTVVAIVVESVLPYTLCGIAFLVAYGIGSPTSIGFMMVYEITACLSPQMLILRTIQGGKWEDTTRSTAPVSSINFSPSSGGESRETDTTNIVELGTLPKGRSSDGDQQV